MSAIAMWIAHCNHATLQPCSTVTLQPLIRCIRTLFGADAEMLAADHIARLIEQFGFVLHGSCT